MCQLMSVYRGATMREMGVETGVSRGTMELKVPCSATELPARYGRDSSSKTQEKQRGPPMLSDGRDSLCVSLSEEK